MSAVRCIFDVSTVNEGTTPAERLTAFSAVLLRAASWAPFVAYFAPFEVDAHLHMVAGSENIDKVWGMPGVDEVGLGLDTQAILGVCRPLSLVPKISREILVEA